MKKLGGILVAFIIIGMIYGYFSDGNTNNSSGSYSKTSTYSSNSSSGSSSKNNSFNYSYPDYSSYDSNYKSNVDRTCPICHGSGEEVCSSCHGSRYLSQTKYAPNYGSGTSRSYDAKISCPACNGTGNTICFSCLGDGQI